MRVFDYEAAIVLKRELKMKHIFMYLTFCLSFLLSSPILAATAVDSFNSQALKQYLLPTSTLTQAVNACKLRGYKSAKECIAGVKMATPPTGCGGCQLPVYNYTGYHALDRHLCLRCL